MTDTQDYAGLIPQDVMDAARAEWKRVAEKRGNWDAALEAALRVSHRTLLESNAALERELDEANDTPAWDALKGCQKLLVEERKKIVRLADRVDELEARLAEADRVIAPFAEVAEWDIGDGEDDDDIFWPMSNARYSVAGRLRVKNLRAARAYRDRGDA